MSRRAGSGFGFHGLQEPAHDVSSDLNDASFMKVEFGFVVGRGERLDLDLMLSRGRLEEYALSVLDFAHFCAVDDHFGVDPDEYDVIRGAPNLHFYLSFRCDCPTPPECVLRNVAFHIYQ